MCWLNLNQGRALLHSTLSRLLPRQVLSKPASLALWDLWVFVLATKLMVVYTFNVALPWFERLTWQKPAVKADNR